MLLDEILEPGAITTVFQPILVFPPDGGQHLYGYEALTRGPSGTHASRADMLFEYVRRKHAEAQVDRVCAVNALRAARALPSCPHLTINVHASTLGQDTGFIELLVETASDEGFRAEQLTVEVVEHSSHWSSSGFSHALASLRSLGIAVALDDIGFGHSNLHMVLEVRPQMMKIDRYFVAGIARDPGRQAVVRAVLDLGRALESLVVAEGVETAQDLAALRALGVVLAQGYLFTPPLPAAMLAEWGLQHSEPLPLTA